MQHSLCADNQDELRLCVCNQRARRKAFCAHIHEVEQSFPSFGWAQKEKQRRMQDA